MQVEEIECMKIKKDGMKKPEYCAKRYKKKYEFRRILSTNKFWKKVLLSGFFVPLFTEL